MRFEFWIDYLCPVTYLTHKNLIEALEELDVKHFDLFYRSYQIDADEVNLSEENVLLLKKHNLKVKDFNTDNIHQLAHLAKRKQKSVEFTTLILESIFKENKNLEDTEELRNYALKAGLDKDDVDNVLKTSCYTKQISCNKINAVNRKINLIPHIRINIKHNISGYHTKDELVTIIKDIIKQLPKTEYCGEDCLCGTY